MPANSLEEYKQLIEKEPQLGDKYVIIDAKWFEHWKRSVGLTKSDEDKVTDPGAIDFTSLALEIPDANSLDEVQLRPDAIENKDYVFIPFQLYQQLKQKHGKHGREIIRNVVPRGEYEAVIETFLVPLRLRESRSNRAKVQQIYCSRRTRIEKLREAICNEFGITYNANNHLYTSTDEEGINWEPIDEGPELVIEDVDLTKNAFIIYESRPVSTRLNSATYQQKTNYIPGLCGLSNLGNTCFMNSALQCLSNVPSLTKYFLTDEYKQHVNRDNPLGMKGDVAEAYGQLVHEMWSGRNSSYAPKSLKHSVARYAPQFSGYAQQDSQEFMSFLLDGLHEDLNLVKKKPYMDKIDDDGKRDDVTLANEQWEYYLKRNQSKIQELFHGQIKSIVQCLTCKTKARTFDPICFLSLPLPGKSKIRTFKIEYVRLNGQIKTYSLKSNEHGRMSNLVQEFCDCFRPKSKNTSKTERMEVEKATAASNQNNHDEQEDDEDDQENEEEEEKEDFTKEPDYDGHQPKPDHILMAEVYNHRIHLQYSDNSLLTNILDRDQIVFYETADSLKKQNSDTILMPCVFREENTRQNFGYPVYINIPRHNCYGKDILKALQDIVGKFLPLSSSGSSEKSSYTPYCLINSNYSQQTKLLESMLNDHFEFGRTNASLVVEVGSSVIDKYKKQEEEREEKSSKKKHLSPSSSIDNIIQSNNHQQKPALSLNDCFKLFTKKEILSTDDLWNCPKCKEMKRASKKIDIWLLPKVLIVQLKRFNYNRYFRDKIDTLVDCPLRNLDLSQFVLNSNEKSKAQYDLIGVSNHMGGLGGGHYTAHAKNAHDRKWHTFDDSWVTEVPEDNVISKSAYVLIYQQKDQSAQQASSGLNESTKK